MFSVLESNLTLVPIFSPDTSLREAIAHLANQELNCLLVGERGQLQGWLTAQDVVKLAAQGRIGDDCSLSSVMTQPPYTLSLEEAEELSLVLQYLQKYQVNQLPVVAESGELLGLVTAQGIMTFCQKQIHDLERLEQQTEHFFLAQTEQDYLLQEITNSIPGIIYIYDLEEQRNIYCSQTIEHFLGYTSLEIQNMGQELLSILVHPEDLPNILALAEIQKTIIAETDRFWEMNYRMRHTDGSWRWIYSQDRPFRRYPDGRTKQMIGVAQDITIQKQIELELQSREYFLNHITETIPGIIYIYDLQENRNVYINSPGLEILGYTRTQIDESGNNFLGQIINKEDFAVIKPLIMEQLATKKIAQSEYRIKDNRGEWRWVLEQTVVFKSSPEGVPTQILGIVINIADIHDRKVAEAALKQANIELEQKVAERTQSLGQTNFNLALEIIEKNAIAAALHESEELFRGVFEQAAVGINIVDTKGKFLLVNQKICQMTGYSKEELLTMTWMELIPPQFLAKALAAGSEARSQKSGKNIEKHLIRKDGSRIWIQSTISAIHGILDQEVCDLSIVQDISEQQAALQERKQAELALQKSEDRFQGMMANIPGIIYQFCCDAQGNYSFTYVSNFIRELYEIEPSELTEDFNSFMRRYPPRDLPGFYNSVEESRRSMQPWNHIYTIVTPSRKLKWIEGNSRPQKQENGDILWDGILMDVSDRQAAEAQISAALQEKELLLKEIHHRVKNNLQVISSLLTLQSQNLDPDITALFKESQRRIYSIALIHEQLYSSTQFDKINFAEYVRSLVSYLGQLYNSSQNLIKLETTICDMVLNVETAIPCGLIINEIVANALKYAFPEGVPGQITIKLEQIKSEQLHNSNYPRFSLSIKDNGIGIDEAIDIENTETLGLRLVKMLTQQLDGEITIISCSGTQFLISFSELNYHQRFHA